MNQLIEHITPNSTLFINGESYLVLAKARYETEKGGDGYIKVFLSNDHALVYLLDGSEGTLLVKNYGAILPEFPTPKAFSFQEQDYVQVCHDTQILKEVFFGKEEDYEADLEIIDYEGKNDDSLFISIGFIPETGERADLAGKCIDVKDISIIN